MPDLHPVQFDVVQKIEWSEWGPVCAPRLKYASKLDIRHLPELEPHDATCAIVGGGPTAEQYLPAIRYVKSTGRDLVMPVNAMHGWLIERDVVPHVQVIFEPDIEDLEKSLGGPPHPDVIYYIASHCPRHVFQTLANYKRVLWHAFCPFQGYQNIINRLFPGEFMVAGGYCTFFRTLSIATVLGFRNFELFGLDSSFEDTSHIEGYGGYHDVETEIKLYGTNPQQKEMRKFTTNGGLAYQAREFIRFCEENQKGLRLRIHGDGLLRYLHESRYPEQYQT